MKAWSLLLAVFATSLINPLFLNPLYAEEFKIGMQGWEFRPKEVTITEGDTIKWINDDDSHHLVIFFEDPSVKSSENIKPGNSYSLIFEKAGTYKYNCRYHADNGMSGTIIVTPRK